jgi:hypothetical protein
MHPTNKCCRDAKECPLSPEEHNARIISLRANLARGQGGARTVLEEEKNNEITKLLSNLIEEKEICAHMQEVHAGSQKCGGCPIPVDIVIPIAGFQPTLEKFLELNKDEFKLGNPAFNEILTYWKESLEKIDHKCQKGSVSIYCNFFALCTNIIFYNP